MEIGERIRIIRQEKKMTLAELSEKSGVAQATLSRIENSIMTGTLKSHMKICEAFGIALSDLYRPLQERTQGAEIETSTTGKDLFVHDEKSSAILLTSQTLSKKMMPILIQLAPDGKTAAEEAKDGTEKFLYCLSGKVRVSVNKKSYSLNAGDRLYFDASLPHFIENEGKGEARCLSVSSPPAL